MLLRNSVGMFQAPILKDRLFFYGAYNPGLNKVYWLAPSVAGLYSHGAFHQQDNLEQLGSQS